METKMGRWGWIAALLLAAALVGCAARTPQPATAEPSPAPTSMPAATPTEGPPSDRLVGRLLSPRVEAAPVIDGQVEEGWAAAPPLLVPLTWGREAGAEHALDLELRALHTADAVSLLARWPGAPPSEDENVVLNKLTLHWRIPEPAAQSLDCTVVCHTAFADGAGRFVYANSETIPQGGSEGLSAAGKWAGGIWTLEWSRPLESSNPFDLLFGDPDQSYVFRVKVFERVDGRADPASGRYELVFQP